MPRNKIKHDFHFTTLKRFKIICELKRALYGIKCVLRIFLTNMAEHIIEEEKNSTLCKHRFPCNTLTHAIN